MVNVACISTRTQNTRNQRSLFTGKPEIQVPLLIVKHEYITVLLQLIDNHPIHLTVYVKDCDRTLPLSTRVFMLQIVKRVCFQPRSWFMQFYFKMSECLLLLYLHENSGTHFPSKWKS